MDEVAEEFYFKDHIRFRVEVDMPPDLMNGTENIFSYKYMMHEMSLTEVPHLTEEQVLREQLSLMVDEIVREIAGRLRVERG